MTFADCRLQTADRRLQTADCRPQTADRRLQTADCRLQTADCMRQQDCKLYETKNIIIKVASSSTLHEAKFFHANYTDLIPEGVVGCSSRIELEQNNVCRCHNLAYESIASNLTCTTDETKLWLYKSVCETVP